MPQKQKLIDYFRRIMPLSDEEAAAILASMTVRTYPRGTLLLREGQIATECYFVLEGCVRQYILQEGQERTNAFFTEEQWVLTPQTFGTQTPAGHYLICAEACTLVVGTEQKENDLYGQYRKFETISRKILETILATRQADMITYLSSTPEQRYLHLLTTRPTLLHRIPQYQLASYLGIQPESLSRIRKRIAKAPAPIR